MTWFSASPDLLPGSVFYTYDAARYSASSLLLHLLTLTCILDGSEHVARGGCAVEVAAIGAQGLSDLHATAGIRAN